MTPHQTVQQAVQYARAQLMFTDPATGCVLAYSGHSTVLFFRAYVEAGGLVLSPKLWRVEAGAHQRVADAVARGLERGWDVSRTMQAFMDSGDAEEAVRDRWGPWQLGSSAEHRAIIKLLLREMNRAMKGVQKLQADIAR